MTISRPISATVNYQALTHNLHIVRQLAPASKVWSVVKANAYGHGLARCYQALSATDGFALLNLEEAIFLREQGVTKPLLLLEGFFRAKDLALIERYSLTICVHSEWQLQALASYQPVTPIDVYLKVNTGMNRLGFMPEQAAAVWEKLNRLTAVGGITLMSHFARADEGAEFITEQVKRMALAVKGLHCPVSLANSAATLWHPDTHHQWIRPGIILYGASPSGLKADIVGYGLKPVMALDSEIIAIQQVAAGEGIGYGHHYQCAYPLRVGIVACGYADGYPRHAPCGTPVAVNGVVTQTLGKVSMDMMVVDLTPCPQAQIGSPVQLWGEEVSVDNVALASGTVGYELLCAVAPRVPFRVINVPTQRQV